MKPYYEDSKSGIVIYHGDCRVIVPQLGTVDLVITDPPYGIGEARGKNKSRGRLAVSKDYGISDWDNSPPPSWLIELIRSMSKYQVFFGGNYFSLPPSSCWLVWDKVNGESDFADCELAWTNFPKAVRRIQWRWAGMLQEDMSNKEYRCHPTQKPLAVMKWVISQAPKECKTLLDPFMGSGTTLVAAKALGLSAIGVEMDESYCESAAKRLSQEILDFSSPEATHEPA